MIKDGCAIQICDNGPGIPEKDIHHLTEAFYRVDKSVREKWAVRAWIDTL